MSGLTAIEDYVDALLDETPNTAGGPEGLPPSEQPGAMPGDLTVTPTSPLPPQAIPLAVVIPAPAPNPVALTTAAPDASPHRNARAAPQPPVDPVASASLPAMPTTHRWLRVAVGNDSYALELLRVQEVVRLVPIVAMRGAARAVLGAMNLRGRIVPVFDLGLWLDAGCVHGDERSRIVVVERDDELIGVLVSAIDDVVTLGRDRIEPPLAGSHPGAIMGIARVGPTPTVLLDANALFG